MGVRLPSLGMTTMAITPAELALHLGFQLPPDPDRNALASESLAEAAWLAVPRIRFCHEQMAGLEDMHTYILTEGRSAEEAFWNDMDLEQHTKYAIARHLEIDHGWSRARLWNRSTADLRAAVNLGVAPWDQAAPPAAPPAEGVPGGLPADGAPGGRGGGRARGRGVVAPAPGRAPGGRGRGRAQGRGRGRGRA